MSTMIPVIWILEIDLLKQRVDPTQPPRVNGTVQSQENIPGVSFFPRGPVVPSRNIG